MTARDDNDRSNRMMITANGPCGWRVWQEKLWPHQWIGQCNRTVCPGGIRCNDQATAVAFKSKTPCVADRRSNA